MKVKNLSHPLHYFRTPMSAADHEISSCRHCFFYKSEGRRGGHCHQLGVPVQGQWKVCSLAASPFSTSWRALETLMRLPEDISVPGLVAVSDTQPQLATESLESTPLL